MIRRRRTAPVFFPRRRSSWRPVLTVAGWLVVFGLAFAFMIATVSGIIDEDGARVPTSPATAEHDHDEGFPGAPAPSVRWASPPDSYKLS